MSILVTEILFFNYLPHTLWASWSPRTSVPLLSLYSWVSSLSFLTLTTINSCVCVCSCVHACVIGHVPFPLPPPPLISSVFCLHPCVDLITAINRSSQIFHFSPTGALFLDNLPYLVGQVVPVDQCSPSLLVFLALLSLLFGRC